MQPAKICFLSHLFIYFKKRAIYIALKIKKICFSLKVLNQPCRPKSDSALAGAI